LLVVISYDVSTKEAEGRRRLHRIAKLCEDFGQRVQNSVFECSVDPKQWTLLRIRLLDEFDPDEDSLRFYFLGANYKRRIEHHGIKKTPDLDAPLVI